MDRAAQELELDPAEIRRRNFIQPEQMPYSVGLTFRDGKPLVYDSGDYPKAQSEALRLIDHAGSAGGRAGARAKAAIIGIGLANYVEGTGLGPYEGVDGSRSSERQGRRRHRRHQPGPGHPHDFGAGRRRSPRLPLRRHRR